jgi:hypothetical protein
MALLSRADPLTGKQEQQMFNSGLLDELCFDVEMHKPRDLEHAIIVFLPWRPWAGAYAAPCHALALSAPLPVSPTTNAPPRAIHRLTPRDGGAAPPRPLLQL